VHLSSTAPSLKLSSPIGLTRPRHDSSIRHSKATLQAWRSIFIPFQHPTNYSLKDPPCIQTAHFRPPWGSVASFILLFAAGSLDLFASALAEDSPRLKVRFFNRLNAPSISASKTPPSGQTDDSRTPRGFKVRFILPSCSPVALTFRVHSHGRHSALEGKSFSASPTCTEVYIGEECRK